MLHTIQDSYCLAHCWRCFDETVPPNREIENGDIWKIWLFQGYDEQNTALHGIADMVKVKNGGGYDVETIGYIKALEASKFVLTCYKTYFVWEELKNGKLYDYLNDIVYAIYPNQKDVKIKKGNSSHPWFSGKRSLGDWFTTGLSAISKPSSVEKLLYDISKRSKDKKWDTFQPQKDNNL